MRNLAAVILAAGQGTRMKSTRAKVLHPLAGRPMLYYPLNAARETGSQKIVVVVGYEGEQVKRTFSDTDIVYATQHRRLGTADAVMSAREALADFTGDILLLCGDIPLIKGSTLQELIEIHRKEKNSVTVLSAKRNNPAGYGRIVRNRQGAIQKIVEEKDASFQEKKVSEVNSGIYCFDSAFLFKALDSISSHNAQNEYYLTDTIAIARKHKNKAGTFLLADATEVMGINNRAELARADGEIRKQILEQLMLNGVTIIDPQNTYVDCDVQVGRDTVIYPHTFLTGNSNIGSNCLIESGCHIKESEIGSHVTIRCYSVVIESIIRNRAAIGPFAHIRSASDVGEEARVGNFVEVKKTIIGPKTKAAHLSYLGDAEIGSDVNIGAGTITCNYDGLKKHTTVIEDNAFVGSNSELVAPVTIGTRALVGAGSTITKDVPPDAVAIGRGKQLNRKKEPG